MHKILINTHKESNINILKARDYYFDKARFINNRLRKACLLGPIVVSVAGMFLVPVLRKLSYDVSAQWLESYLDVLVGCIAISAFIIDLYLSCLYGEYEATLVEVTKCVSDIYYLLYCLCS